MAIVEKKLSDGYFQASLGEAQIQKKDVNGVVGIVHADTTPDPDVEPDFVINNGDIQYSLGKTKCFLIAISDEKIKIAYMDISGV